MPPFCNIYHDIKLTDGEGYEFEYTEWIQLRKHTHEHSCNYKIELDDLLAS
jgi:hypothetical protein